MFIAICTFFSQRRPVPNPSVFDGFRPWRVHFCTFFVTFCVCFLRVPSGTAFWTPFGGPWGASWGALGPLWGPFGRPWPPPGEPLGAPRAQQGAQGPPERPPKWLKTRIFQSPGPQGVSRSLPTLKIYPKTNLRSRQNSIKHATKTTGASRETAG